MRNVILLCAQGMSTGVMVKKMKDAAAKMGYECNISAHPVAQAKELGALADILLLGPQVRFEKNEVQAQCPNKPVQVIDTVAYGRLDGAKVIAQVKAALGD